MNKNIYLNNLTKKKKDLTKCFSLTTLGFKELCQNYFFQDKVMNLVCLGSPGDLAS